MSGLRRRGDFGLRPVDDFYSLLGDFASTPFGSEMQRMMPNITTFKMDVHETDDSYVVEADMPGVNREDIDVELREGRLSISVNTQHEEEEEKKNYLHRERHAYTATRGIYLKDADSSGVSARLKEGVLTVSVPKKNQDDPGTKIQID